MRLRNSRALMPARFSSLLLVLLALLCATPHARGQEQERKLLDRLTRPDTSLTYDTRKSSFGDRTIATSKVVSGKEFGGARGFVSKDFYAKPYGGSEKKSWLASLFFSTKTANTSGRYEIPNAGQKYDTKAAPTKDATYAEKTMSTNAFASTDLQYLKRSRFDTSIKAAPAQGGNTPLGYTGDMRPMSIDDVRELLNKNK